MSYFFQHGGVDFPNKSRNPIVGGWKELGRTTLGGVGDSISVASLADKRYYMVLGNFLQSGPIYPRMRFNNDSAGNYANRYSFNGSADATQTSQTSGLFGEYSSTLDMFNIAYVSNYSTKEKLVINNSVNNGTAGAGTPPTRDEEVSKWANTADAINRIDAVNLGAGDFAAGSEVVVLGYDPADTSISNFWAELASINATGSSTNLSSGTITAKKYIWVQAWLKNTTSHTTGMTFNNDATTYSYRLSDDGGADSTQVTQGNISVYSAITTPIFVNMFIINNSANEKMVIGHTVSQSTAGAGTACNRREFVGKYDNTAAQITEIDLDSSSGNWDATSIIKVYGSD